MSRQIVHLRTSKNGKRFVAGKKLAKEFERTIEMAELKALSNISLERQLTDNEFNRMMELKKRLL